MVAIPADRLNTPDAETTAQHPSATTVPPVHHLQPLPDGPR